jgi:hypothetical protein
MRPRSRDIFTKELLAQPSDLALCIGRPDVRGHVRITSKKRTFAQPYSISGCLTAAAPRDPQRQLSQDSL